MAKNPPEHLTIEEVIELMKQRQGGMTQREFAAELGIASTTLHDIYSGQRKPGPKVREKLGLEKLRPVILYRKKKEK